ncbi:S-layer protein, partial [Bacillus cereus]
MKKKILKVATALTIMGGIGLSVQGTTANAEVAVKQQQAVPGTFTDVPAGH